MATDKFMLSFVGAGNLAWHLAAAWDNTGYKVNEVYSRNPDHAKQLAGRLYDASVSPTPDFSNSASSIFLLTVADDSIEDMAREIVLPDGALLIHCSGSQPLEILDDAAAANTGVCYPLQTFTKGKQTSLEHVPFLVESTDSRSLAVLRHMAGSLSKRVYEVTSQRRMRIHLAAVFASNFTNHLLAIAEQLLNREDTSFDLLRPLVAETLNKSLDIGPSSAQTGPARRGDLEILDRHMDFLNADPPLQEIYRIISQHILNKYSS